MKSGFSNRFRNVLGGMSPLAAALNELKAAGAPLLDLTQSNPTRAGFDYPDDAIARALAHRAAREYHPCATGLLSARQAVAAYYRDRGRDTAPGDILLTSSTSEAYSFLFKLLCDPGDEVCVPSPSYPLLNYLADLENVVLTTYSLRLDSAPGPFAHWQIDLSGLRAVIRPRTKALVLVNPNNPTGSLVTPEESQVCADLARDRGLALIVDEVFSDYCHEKDVFQPVRSDGALVFTLNGFSKTLGLPHLKLGWIAVDGPPNQKKEALELLEIVADTFLSVNTPVQTACADLLALRGPIQEEIRARLANNLSALQGLFPGDGMVAVLTPQAGWYVILRVDTVVDEEALALTLLRSAQVYVHPGHLFGLEAGCHFVASLLTPESEFQEGCRRIAEFAFFHAH